MPQHKKFIARARTQLKVLRRELTALERSPASGKTQLQKLWAEWQVLSASVERLAKAVPGRRTAAINQLKADAESHWLALEVVVASHRELSKGRLAHA